MLKAIGVILLFAAAGGIGYWLLSPILLPHVSNLIPTLTGFITDAPSKLGGIIDYVKQNWQLIAGSVGTVTVVAGYIGNWIHKRKLQAQEVVNMQKVNEYQTIAIQAQGSEQRLQQNYDLLNEKYTQLAESQPEKAELIQRNVDLERELIKVTTQRNQFAALVPDKETIKKIEGILEKAEHVH
jgi:hypothetical protein